MPGRRSPGRLRLLSGGDVPIRRETSAGASQPLTAIAPSGSRANRWASRRAVVSPTRIVPGSAALCSRDGDDTSPSPKAMACGLAPPTMPTAARPLLMPTRTAKPEIPQAVSTSRAYRSTSSRMRRAARAARSGSSLCADGTPKYDTDAVALVRLHGAPVLLGARLMSVTQPPMSTEDLVGGEPLGQRCRADDVCEEDRHGAYLACGQRARREPSVGGASSAVEAGSGALTPRSWRRIACSSSWSAGLGSMPSSSSRACRAVAIDLERLGLTARSVEREHQLAAEPLTERVFQHEGLRARPTSSPWRPSARSASMRFSTAASRSSSSRRITGSANGSYVKSASGGPRQRAEPRAKQIGGAGRRRRRRERGFPPRRDAGTGGGRSLRGRRCAS